MTPSFAPGSPATASDPDLELDGFVAAFESAVAVDPAADPVRFLPPPDHPLYHATLGEVVRVDLEFAWDRGDERRVEHYRDRLPQLFAHPSLLRAVVREEMRLRAAGGEELDPAEYDRRFGLGWSSAAIECGPNTTVVQAAVDTDRMPQPGDAVAGFVLDSELGRGAFGRVFLARQADLADRPVVLKVSAKFPGEWRTLARLQHTNVVPVYSVHRHGRFHVACMPYLGRTTLAEVIREVRTGAGATPTVAGDHTDPASGNDPPAPPPVPTTPPLSSRSVEWVMGVGVDLADALAHAHERGILHRDVKPANVLLADDGRPMLLDFNLSDDPAERRADGPFVGGTLRYMAPEHLAALAGDCPPPDERADVYSLGLVLYELLAGRLPFDDPPEAKVTAVRAARQVAPQDVRAFRPEATPAVASILATALAPDPARRYPSAAALRDDLQRQLDHRPLAVAPDRSPRERFRKWRRRHPRLASWATVSALAGLVLAAVVGGFLLRQWHFDAVAAANHLHKLADVRGEVRATLTTTGGPKAEYAAAAAECAAALAGLPDPTDPAWGRHMLVRHLAEADRRKAADLVAELRWLKARAEVLAGKGVSRAEFLAASRAAGNPDDLFPRPDLLTSTRAAAQQALPTLRSASRTESGRWEHWYRLGLCEQRAGDLAAARSHFKLAGDLDDDCPWPLFHLGVAELEAKDPKAAVAAFDQCLARGGDDPAVYLNRAIARIERNEYAAAIADLDRIEPHAADLPRLYFVREAARRRSGDTKGADADRAAGLKLEPTDAHGWNARGEAKLSQAIPDADGAVADFDKAIEIDPELRQAYQNKANALAEALNRPADAVTVLDTAVERFPDYLLARAGRAVLLARLGKTDAARTDAAAILDGNPPAIVCYQAACVYLLTARTDADRKAGVALLRRALRLDPTWAAVMPTDPDVKAVWNSDEFRKLIRAAEVMTEK
jgi:serine/threonine protein kinase/tetratricopeptide (TPR) repeat protein